MDFRATSATRGFNWGFSRPGRIRTSNARSKIWCVTITPQANQGARRIAYTLPLVESVSSAPALAMEEVCVAALETICLALRPVGWCLDLHLTEAKLRSPQPWRYTLVLLAPPTEGLAGPRRSWSAERLAE